MVHAGVTSDPDLENLRAEPAYAALEARIAEPAQARGELKALVLAGDPAALPVLAELAADESQTGKMRSWAASCRADMLLEAGRNAEAVEAFEQAAELGPDVGTPAFGMARALAGLGRTEAARRHVEFALQLGFSDRDALVELLDGAALVAPEELEALVERAAANAKKAAYGKEKQKSWAGETYGDGRTAQAMDR